MTIEIIKQIEQNLIDLDQWFENKSGDLLKWVRSKGGIKSDTKSTDTYSLKQKQSGFKGKASIVRKNGLALDVLRDEAEWEGIITPGITTDQFKEMIEQQINRS